MIEPVVPLLPLEQYEALSDADKKRFMRIYKRQVVPKLEAFRNKAPYKLAYGGRGSGKSWSCVSLLVQMCEAEPHRLVCLREIQRSISESSYRLIVDTIARINSSGWEIGKEVITHSNGSRIIFRGLHDMRANNSIKSLEGYDLCFLEEAQAISKDSLTALLPTIRKNNAEIWACWNPETPDDPIEKLKSREGALCVEVNWGDNPFFTERSRKEMEQDYRENADEAEHIWGGKYRKQGDNCIMNRVSIREAINRKADSEGEISIGVDCARYGNDRTTMFKRKGLQLIDYKIYKKMSMTESADMFELFCDRKKDVHACIDGGGVGGGLIDILRERGYSDIQDVNFGERAIDCDKYENAVSEMWFTFPLADCGLLDIDGLAVELSDRHFKFNKKGQKCVESKDDYKKRHGGKSPDLADGLLLCYYERHDIMPMLY